MARLPKSSARFLDERVIAGGFVVRRIDLYNLCLRLGDSAVDADRAAFSYARLADDQAADPCDVDAVFAVMAPDFGLTVPGAAHD